MKNNIAIIGGGIAGLTAGYLLSEKYNVTLYEKENRIGGNAYTYEASSGETFEIAAASVAAPAARNFLKLCEKAGIPNVRKSGFPVSIHDADSGEGIYLSLNPKSLLAQKTNMLKRAPSLVRAFYSMIKAIKLLDKGQLKGKTIEEMFGLLPELDHHGRLFMMAFPCLLSVMPYEDVYNAPAEFFVNKLKVHKVTNPFIALTNNTFPKNFTRSYVNAFASPFKDGIAMNTAVEKVERNNKHVVIKMKDGAKQTFEKVIFACGADQALSLLEKPTKNEKRLLGQWRYTVMQTVVHRDTTHLPNRELCLPWTLVHSTKNGSPHFSHYYCSWLLSPSTPKGCEYLATHYPAFPIKEELIENTKSFRVPIFDFSSYATQKELPSLNGNMNSYYCGSYFGIGLHGAGVDSAIDVAKQLGVDYEIF